jgi:hypothetical protein
VAVVAARARGDTALDQQVLAGLRECYDTAATFGMTGDGWAFTEPTIGCGRFGADRTVRRR